MDFLYCASQDAYAAGVLTIMEIVRVRDDLDVPAYETKYDQTVILDMIAPGGALPAPWGSPTALVMDTTGESAIVREKGETEILQDRKKSVLGQLDNLTRTLIKRVCDDDKQKTLSLLAVDMTSEQFALYQEYILWHRSTLGRHFSLQDQINAYTDLSALEGFAQNMETEYDDLMDLAPWDSVNLRNYT